jgi:membrane peptidoglycan carboxypeptidase
MLKVVQDGTGTTAQVPGVDIGGKTGTAQHYRHGMQDLTTWFYCYGPWQNPRYVTCVMVEGGQWGATAAAPIAGSIMKQLFAMDAGTPVSVAALEPVVGNFDGETAIQSQDVATPAAPTATTPDGQAIPAIDSTDMTPASDASPRSPFYSNGTKHAR